MKTVNDKMFFINELHFVGILREDDCKNFNCVRKILKNEFKDLSSERLAEAMCVLDDLYISLKRQDFTRIPGNVKLPREDIFQKINEKLLVSE